MITQFDRMTPLVDDYDAPSSHVESLGFDALRDADPSDGTGTVDVGVQARESGGPTGALVRFEDLHGDRGALAESAGDA